MILKNFYLASFVFFAWLAVDSLCSLLPGGPLEGVFYPGASGWLRGVPHDWTQKPRMAAPLYLFAYVGVWYLVLQKAGGRNGLRVVALITAFAVLPFWLVPLVTADMYQVDMYQVELNAWWVRSMAYANFSFFLYGFLGSGRTEDLHF